jgi:hypothetical protein
VARGTTTAAAPFFGFARLGLSQPTQAEADPGTFGPPYPLGQVTCLPEVFDWPFSSDSAGLSFDQANLLGIRGLAYNDQANGNQESDDYLIAVPRSFPSGYTRRGRVRQDPYTSLLTPSVLGNSYSMRDAGNVWYPGPTGADLQYWAPCNVGQQVYDGLVDSAIDFWGTDDPVTPTKEYALAYQTTHCGFRDARLELSANIGSAAVPVTSVTVAIYWDEPGTVLSGGYLRRCRPICYTAPQSPIRLSVARGPAW